jgi:hypothetical protein
VERGRRKNSVARDPILFAAACRVATPRDAPSPQLAELSRQKLGCTRWGDITRPRRKGAAQRAELSFDVSPPLAIRVFVIGAAARTRVRFDEVAARMDDMLLPFAFLPRFCRYLWQRDSGFTVLFHQSYHVSQVSCMVLKHELWFAAWKPRTVGFLLHSFFA